MTVIWLSNFCLVANKVTAHMKKITYTLAMTWTKAAAERPLFHLVMDLVYMLIYNAITTLWNILSYL
jgi:hypothetical protein